MSWASKHPYLVLALLVLAVCIPFLNQAVHIDDRIYLEVADTILENRFTRTITIRSSRGFKPRTLRATVTCR